jgi:hypothetical protein
MGDGFFYPLGLPLSSVVKKLSIPSGARINVVYDDEAQVFVATSKDLSGLVVESETIEQLMTETNELIPMLLSDKHLSSLIAVG